MFRSGIMIMFLVKQRNADIGIRYESQYTFATPTYLASTFPLHGVLPDTLRLDKGVFFYLFREIRDDKPSWGCLQAL